jgi:hypothetical protein
MATGTWALILGENAWAAVDYGLAGVNLATILWVSRTLNRRFNTPLPTMALDSRRPPTYHHGE